MEMIDIETIIGKAFDDLFYDFDDMLLLSFEKFSLKNLFSYDDVDDSVLEITSNRFVRIEYLTDAWSCYVRLIFSILIYYLIDEEVYASYGVEKLKELILDNCDLENPSDIVNLTKDPHINSDFDLHDVVKPNIDNLFLEYIYDIEDGACIDDVFDDISSRIISKINKEYPNNKTTTELLRLKGKQYIKLSALEHLMWYQQM